MNIEIKQLNDELMNEFLEVAKAFFNESYHKNKTLKIDEYANILRMSFGLGRVAVPLVLVEGKIAGYAIINYYTDCQVEREGDMYQMYVHPDYRGNGASRALAAEVTRQFDEWGCVDSHIWAAPGIGDDEEERKKAVAVFRNLWAKYGYAESGIIMSRKGRI